MTKKNIFDTGWEIFDTVDINSLNNLRNDIYSEIKKEFNLEEDNPEIGLNNFHKLSKNISETDLNQKKINVIGKISSNKKLVDLIFNSYSKHILNFLGNDLLVQKTINLVIQMPKDRNPTIPHRDAPPNSYFELVLWIPLVNCKETKSMYLIDMTSTKESLDKLDLEPENWNNFLKNFEGKKVHPEVKFGQSVFFLPYIYHGSDFNKTDETRFSLNIRFKGLFSPSGRKFPLHFYRMFKISKFSQLALQKTKEEISK